MVSRMADYFICEPDGPMRNQFECVLRVGLNGAYRDAPHAIRSLTVRRAG